MSDMARAADVPTRRVYWLWKNLAALGKLTILDGRPGIFKSGMLLDIAARVTTGRDMPTGPSGLMYAENVLICSAEDDPEDTIVPRLIGAGADLDRVFFYDDLEIPAGMEALQEKIVEVDAVLVVIDPLAAFVDGRFDLNHDQKSRRALKPLAEVAKATKAAIWGLRHVKKATDVSAQDAGSGNIAVGGAARSNLLAGRDPDKADHFVLASIKNNLGTRPASLGYHIEQALIETSDGGSTVVPKIIWDGEVALTADDLVAPERQGEAMAFLRDYLAAGPVASSKVQHAAEALSLSWGGAVRRASERMGIVKKPSGMGTPWEWSLPGTATPYKSEELLDNSGKGVDKSGASIVRLVRPPSATKGTREARHAASVKGGAS